jgi:Chaperone of endosialidase
MDKSSEALFALKPVTFRYKGNIDPAQVKMFGLIAEEVAEVNPDLVVRNAKGEVDTIRFDSINAMLLNEFLKEHRKVQGMEVTVVQQKKDFEATIAQQEKEIKSLTASSERAGCANPENECTARSEQTGTASGCQSVTVAKPTGPLYLAKPPRFTAWRFLFYSSASNGSLRFPARLSQILDSNRDGLFL